MGVRFNREYKEINADLAEAIGQIEDIFDFFEMTKADWDDMESEERGECLRTMADDVFYGLGVDSSIPVGGGFVSHDRERHVLKVHCGDNRIMLVQLI